MKKLLVSVVVFTMLLVGNSVVTPGDAGHTVMAEKPPYAKWGKLAMQKTTKQYPNAKIIDYHHVGRDDGEKFSSEKFKLWLKGKDKEFGVIVDIQFDTKTEQVNEITFKEVSK